MTDNDSTPPRKQTVSRLGLYLPTSLLLLIAAAWSGFWFYSAQATNRALDDFVLREASQGRTWTCTDRRLGGYPFRLELRCAAVSIKSAEGGRPVDVRLGEVTVVAQIYNPKLVLAEATAPLDVVVDQTSSRVEWEALRISLRLAGSELQRLSLSATALRATPSPGAPEAEFRAQNAELHLRPDFAQGAGALDVALAATGAVVPALDQAIGSTDPANLEVSGVVKGLTAKPRGDWKEAVEAWRLGGGQVEIATARLVKGPFQAEAAGVLDLDDERRMRGKLDASAVGAGPLMSRWGISSGNKLQQALGGLLGKRADSIVSAAAAMKWPVRFENGRVSVGPVRTPIQIPALY
ncbi:MAG: hypothetical protein JWL93_300 [Hyphomicrobiales bacterium]|nr:hypothetical protein [Hyphomicrobiales bacterium]